MNLYELAVKKRDDYLAGKYQPGMGWFALNINYRGETYHLYDYGTWELYRQTGEGRGKYCFSL